jgi:hypothetical protein
MFQQVQLFFTAATNAEKSGFPDATSTIVVAATV